jgi:uncharacterized protein
VSDLPLDETTRVRRLPERQRTDRAELDAVLDAAMVAHVGVVRDGQPVVIPFASARDGDGLLLHGSTGAGLLRAAAAGEPVCATVTLLDGLVVARSVFDHSMNYRSAVVLGVPEVLEGEAKERALQVITDHLLPGRWSEVRASTRKELAATLVVRLPLDRASVKVRAAPATTAPDDGEDRGTWTGVVPLQTWAGDPQPSDDVPDGVEVPASVRAAVAATRR